MVLDLDPPARTTRDWEGPEVAPQVAAALQAALTPIGEEVISIDASFASLKSVKGSRAAGARPKWVDDAIMFLRYVIVNMYKHILSFAMVWDSMECFWFLIFLCNLVLQLIGCTIF